LSGLSTAREWFLDSPSYPSVFVFPPSTVTQVLSSLLPAPILPHNDLLNGGSPWRFREIDASPLGIRMGFIIFVSQPGPGRSRPDVHSNSPESLFFPPFPWSSIASKFPFDESPRGTVDSLSKFLCCSLHFLFFFFFWALSFVFPLCFECRFFLRSEALSGPLQRRIPRPLACRQFFRIARSDTFFCYFPLLTHLFFFWPFVVGVGPTVSFCSVPQIWPRGSGCLQMRPRVPNVPAFFFPSQFLPFGFRGCWPFSRVLPGFANL